jgi:hypothetical protein
MAGIKKARSAHTVSKGKSLRKIMDKTVRYLDESSGNGLWGKDVEGTGTESFSVAGVCVAHTSQFPNRALFCTEVRNNQTLIVCSVLDHPPSNST